MNFYDLLPRAWLGIDPAEVPLPGAHKAHTSTAEPDSSPKSSPPPLVPSRTSEAPLAYDPTDRAGTDALIDQMTRHGRSPLAAAQALYAPQLLREPHA